MLSNLFSCCLLMWSLDVVQGLSDEFSSVYVLSDCCCYLAFCFETTVGAISMVKSHVAIILRTRCVTLWSGFIDEAIVVVITLHLQVLQYYHLCGRINDTLFYPANLDLKHPAILINAYPRAVFTSQIKVSYTTWVWGWSNFLLYLPYILGCVTPVI